MTVLALRPRLLRLLLPLLVMAFTAISGNALAGPKPASGQFLTAATLIGAKPLQNATSHQAVWKIAPKPTAECCVAAETATPKAFNSFSAFKRAFGSAGEDQQWHHIVEQTPGNVERFGAQAIHSIENLVRVPTSIHQQISGYFSSIRPFTGGLTVRQWLGPQSFGEQMSFGRQILQNFGISQ